LPRNADTKNGYGWISIALHWATVAIILPMWTIGRMAKGAGGENDPALLHLHTTIGMSAYALLWARIIWRFRVGHPGPLPRQGAFLFAFAKYFHFCLLIAIGVMLVSGPLAVWLNGEAIQVFSLAVPSPFPARPELYGVLRAIHRFTSALILFAVGLHVLAVFKHLILNRDGTFDKIMIAGRVQQE
jgi:cytochrome b561